MAAPNREIFNFRGHAFFLMRHQGVLAAIPEQEKNIIILVNDYGLVPLTSSSTRGIAGV